jgi:hypothetical protein
MSNPIMPNRGNAKRDVSLSVRHCLLSRTAIHWRFLGTLLLLFHFSPLIRNGGAISAEQTDEDVLRKLQAFCNTGALMDRGLANTPFSHGTDAWVNTQLLTDAQLVDIISQLQPPSFQSVPSSENPVDKDILDELYFQRTDEIQEAIRQKGGQDVFAKLPYVYLRVEGLMALSRPELRGVFDEPDHTQPLVRRLYVRAWEDQASLAHRALFTLPSEATDEAPTYVAMLRRVTADIDCRALDLLSPAEQQRLLVVIESSRSLDRLVYGPGSSITDFYPQQVPPAERR